MIVISGEIDRITGRIKKAAGDLVDDPELRQQGVQEERKADAKKELAEAQREADLKADEVARLERRTAGHGDRGAGHGDPTPGQSSAAPREGAGPGS